MNRKVRNFVSCLVKGWVGGLGVWGVVQDKISSPAKNRNWLICLVRLEYPETVATIGTQHTGRRQTKQKKKQTTLNR
jgi:hypothetical protein